MSRYSLAVGMARAEEIALLARQAEDAGFEALWAAEMSHEPFDDMTTDKAAGARDQGPHRRPPLAPRIAVG